MHEVPEETCPEILQDIIADKDREIVKLKAELQEVKEDRDELQEFYDQWECYV